MRDFETILREAEAAGIIAAAHAKPTPMIVQQHVNPIDDTSPVSQEWYVADGPCGFATILVRPANCAFAKWLRTCDNATYSQYHHAVMLFDRLATQSLARKEAYAAAVTKYLQEHIGELSRGKTIPRISYESRLD